MKLNILHPVRCIGRGQFELPNQLCLVGANGSGKSTLLQLIISALVSNYDQSNSHKHYRGAYNVTWFSQVSLEDADYTHSSSYSKYSDYQGAGLSHLEYFLEGQHKAVTTCSSGQCQFTIVSDLLMAALRLQTQGHRPLVILDEPELSLDTPHVAALAHILKRYISVNGAILMATHSPMLMAAMSSVHTLHTNTITNHPTQDYLASLQQSTANLITRLDALMTNFVNA